MNFSLEVAKPYLRHTPLVLGTMLSQLSREWTHESEAPGSWTPFEVVGHMTYVEENDWMHRTQIILEHGTSCVFDPIDREAGFERYRDLSLNDVLKRFASIRSSNLLLLDSLVQRQDLERRGIHPDFGEVRLDQLLSTWVVHDLNHIGQIVKTMAKLYGDAVGPWRAYLPIVDAP
jgi:uncharacterized damage-inducible protein DinB